MNKKMMAVLFASGNESKLNELTLHRTTASLPFAGRYRLIDFALSSLVNSGITRIGIVTRSNYSSLMDHIRMGRDWDLNRKNSGIAVFPPFGLNTSRDVYKGKIEALYTILDFLERAPEDYVCVSNSNIASNIKLDDILDEHIARGADLTMLCHKANVTTSKRVIITKDENDKVTDLCQVEIPSADEKLVSLNIYVVKKDTLIGWIEQAYARGYVDFEKDILFREVESGKIYAKEITTYAAIVDDVKTYYNESMKVLRDDVREELFETGRKVYTKVKDSVPTIYGEKSSVENSLIADGCVINGTVENSILFRDVTIEEGAVVKNSIIMEHGVVMKDGQIAYTITDKSVVIGSNRQISGSEDYPIAIVKNKKV
ncbi:MAG: glucose-1-phosphate adenylyltransferase subunit GlgD [Clostridia bacterium]|nr:glucose-1-phosphate adenylyltransferase subunit GlgD [Clostridia bacterium]